MRQITIKLIATLLTLILCISCLSACSDNKTQDNQNTNSTENYYVDENTGDIIDDTTGEVIDDENLKVNEETGEIIDTSKVENTEKTDKEETNSESKDTESTKQDVENKTPENSTSETNNTVCSHNGTTVKNKTSATCTKTGYTGDTYCTKCNKKLSSGSSVPATGHDTEIRNKKDATTTSEGYTGDKVCKTCNTVVENGKKTPKVENNTDGKVTYTTNNGYTYIVDEGTNIMEYSMKQQTKHIDSPYREFELEILRLCNEERAKNGLASLEWYEDAYYFTYIRAEESSKTFSHTRPNWSNWDTVYTDANVILQGTWGENLFYSEGLPVSEIAEEAVINWMNSPGHKANILNPKYTKLTVAIYEKYIGETLCLSVTQNFFG